MASFVEKQKPITHNLLIELGFSWLKHVARSYIILTEWKITEISETPDLYGVNKWGESIVIECKARLDDFCHESDKHRHSAPGLGLGQRRYYLAPYGVVKPMRLRGNWGLLEVLPDRTIKTTVESGVHSPRGASELAFVLAAAQRSRRSGDRRIWIR